MKKNVLFFTALFFVTFSLFAFDDLTVYGQIQNSNYGEISIHSINDRMVASSKIDDKGEFNIKTDLKDKYYFIQYGRERFYVYLKANERLKISFDGNDLEDTLIFEGEGAERNSYLHEKSKLRDSVKSDTDTFYKVSENKYLNNLDGLSKLMLDKLESHNLDSSFIKEEKKSIRYEYLLGIKNFKSFYKFYYGEELNLSKNFLSPLKNLDLRNMDDYRSHQYYYYLVNSIWSTRIENEKGFTKKNKKLHEIKDNEIALSLIIGFYNKIKGDKSEAEEYYKLIKSNIRSSKFIQAAKEKLDEIPDSLKGLVSKDFSYKDVNGNIVSLSDFKGSYVYIDVWATWCSPCLKQVPYLKKLEQRFKESNIIFISISVDKIESFDAWKKMVKDKSLGGIQLFADNSFDSEFIKFFNIHSIPSFILIDKEGKILDEKAPYPSYSETESLFESLD